MPTPAPDLVGEAARTFVQDGNAGMPEIHTVRQNDSPFTDEFADLMARREKASVGPNGEHLDEFYTHVQNQQAGHEALTAIAPFSRSNPPSVTGAILGSTVTVNDANNFDTTNCPTVCNWAGQNEETLPVTITLSPVQRVVTFAGGSKATPIFDPIGIITWGTRGVTVQAIVDIGQGCQFTVGASVVIVQVGMTQNNSNASMSISGMLSFQSPGHGTPVTRTLNLPGDTSNVNIPSFAKTVSLAKNDFTQSTTLKFSTLSPQTWNVIVAANTFIPTPILIPNTALYVSASAGSAVGSLVFQLCL